MSGEEETSGGIRVGRGVRPPDDLIFRQFLGIFKYYFGGFLQGLLCESMSKRKRCASDLTLIEEEINNYEGKSIIED